MFVAVGNGQIQWRLPDGTLNATLDTGLGGYTTGMAFDKQPGNLYVTNFTAGAVTRFDTSGNRLGTFGSGYNHLPESILFDAAGDVFVGQAGGSRDVLRFDGGGQLRSTYDVPTGPVGSDWIDLSIDQCTLLYTPEGPAIRRFNICTNTPLNDLTGLLNQAFALRILPGERAVLVADRTTIQIVDGITGGLFQSYDAPGQDCWFALNLDPDGTSFWSADFCTSMVYKFDIASGAVLQSFSTETPPNTVFGLVVNGEFSDARNRNCSSENISLGRSAATPTRSRSATTHAISLTRASQTTRRRRRRWPSGSAPAPSPRWPSTEIGSGSPSQTASRSRSPARFGRLAPCRSLLRASPSPRTSSS